MCGARRAWTKPSSWPWCAPGVSPAARSAGSAAIPASDWLDAPATATEVLSAWNASMTS